MTGRTQKKASGYILMMEVLSKFYEEEDLATLEIAEIISSIKPMSGQSLGLSYAPMGRIWTATLNSIRTDTPLAVNLFPPIKG